MRQYRVSQKKRPLKSKTRNVFQRELTLFIVQLLSRMFFVEFFLSQQVYYPSVYHFYQRHFLSFPIVKSCGDFTEKETNKDNTKQPHSGSKYLRVLKDANFAKYVASRLNESMQQN